MKKYDSYKQSGFSWIGEIPSHWKTTRLRNLLSMVSEKGHGDKQLLSVTREQGVIIRDVNSKESNHNFIPEDLNGYKLVKVGQFAINKMKAWQGSYAVSSYEGIVSPAYYICDLNFDNKDFFSWAIRSRAYVPFFTQMSKGIRVDQWDLSTDALKEIPFFIPDNHEQEKIVEFLSSKTLIINAQQRERERELRLLEELKQAEMANVVTRGLNPDVPMKDSGIPWIGQIPAHWEVMRMKRIFSESKEKTENDGGQLLSLSQYTGITPKVEGQKIGMFEAESTIGYNIVHPGQFVMNIMLAWNGSYAVSDYEGIISPAYCVFNFNIDCEKKYFHYLLRQKAYSGAFKTQSKGIIESRLRLYPDYFYNFPCIVPPIDEQKAIVEYIEQKNKTIDNMISNLKSQKDFLTEYKQRLISDAVTGQIDVGDYKSETSAK